MLAYAAKRPAIGARQSNPHAMLIVIAVHVAGVAALMSAKMDLPQKIFRTPTEVRLIPAPPPPPANRAPDTPQPRESRIVTPPAEVPLPPMEVPLIEPAPAPLDFDAIVQPQPQPQPQPRIQPRVVPAPTEARLVTPASDLKPPYPQSKLLSEEEAALRLRLSIDENGRVTAVEPVGSADRVFLDAARRHLIAKWRYRPATAEGRPVATSIVVTLRFQLDT